MDTGLSLFLEEIPRFVAEDSDIVLGFRDESEAPLHCRLTSCVVNRFLGGTFTDYTSSYRLYQKGLLTSRSSPRQEQRIRILVRDRFQGNENGIENLLSASEFFRLESAGESKMSYRVCLTDYVRFL